MTFRRDKRKRGQSALAPGTPGRTKEGRSLTKTTESKRARLVLDESVDPRHIYGQFDENLRQIEEAFSAKVSARGNVVFVEGEADEQEVIRKLFRKLEQLAKGGNKLSRDTVQDTISHFIHEDPDSEPPAATGEYVRLRKMRVNPRNPRQREFLEMVSKYDLTFAIGPAGTGKTYMAVAFACHALQEGQVERIILTRPAVEAGEKLGFLPGDLAEKINPYLRPLYDALYDMLGPDKVMRYMERGTIEVAPLAFMRGRTLNNSFIILDEAQNTTNEQMKMFLTRLGQNSKAVVTGDVTQIDLPRGSGSGLIEAWDFLNGIDGIGFTRFGRQDIVRHKLVQRIVDAYESRQSPHSEPIPSHSKKAAPVSTLPLAEPATTGEHST